MEEIIFGINVATLVRAVMEHSIPHKLMHGPQTVAELCENSGLLPAKLERVLLALEAFGYFRCDRATVKWRNTEASEFLTHPLAQFLQTELHPYRVTTGKYLADILKDEDCTAFQLAYQQPFFEYAKGTPSLLENFQAAMNSYSLASAQDVIAAANFHDVSSVLDVGGGDGTLLLEVLRHYPHLTGGILELPEVCDKVEAREKEYGIEVTKHRGSFFDEVPRGYDCIMMKHILHDWPDERALVLLHQCRAAMQPGQVLYIIDAVLRDEEPNDPYFLHCDLRMMLSFNGKERRLSQFQQLLSQSGFALLNTSSGFNESVLKAVATKK